MNTTTIEQAVQNLQHALERITPGEPYRVSNAITPADKVKIRQGDLYLCIISDDEIPDNYQVVSQRVDADRQLVPGNTQGSRHCLDSLDGVHLYRPIGWGSDNEDELAGPIMHFTQERTVLHPRHGDITFPAGFTVMCRYQRNYDHELQRARRALD